MTLRSIVLCAALLLHGCPGSSDPPPASTTCVSDSDCVSGKICCTAQNHTCLPDSVCNPPPVSATCDQFHISAGTGAFPAQAPTSCQKPVQPSAYPSGQVQTFGTRSIGETVTFKVASGTGSVSIVQQAVSATSAIVFQGTVIENTVVPGKVFGPDGGLLYDDSAVTPADPSVLPIFYGGSSASTGVMSLPNATPLLSQSLAAGGLPPGNWSFTVNDYAAECVGDSRCTDGGTSANQYDVQVISKAGGLPSQGVLDVNFYLVASQAPFPASAASATPSAQRLAETLAALYRNAGVCLRNVTFYEAPQWAKDAYGTNISADKTGPCDPLDQMFTLSQPGNAINFFLVQSISSTARPGGGTVVGIDGTIPGPSTFGGTVHSGAAVSLANLGVTGCSGAMDLRGCGPDTVAYIAAHEGGHFLGLFHTTEAEGENFDSLTDTGLCPCETCAPASQQSSCATPSKKPPPSQPTLVHASSCVASSCSGGDNLMFWELDRPISRGKLSAQQTQVIRLNPVVQ